MYNVLICDDEKDIVNALKIYLANEGYQLFIAENGEEAVEIAKEADLHLILMDIMMPKMDGITSVLAIREFSNVPVIFLTAKSEDIDKLLGLSIGGDDYITKPFNPLEVVARVKSQIRRYMELGAKPKEKEVFVVDGIELDSRGKTVNVDGVEVFLTPSEYEILKLLMENQGEVFNPKKIYEHIWGESSNGNESTIAVHIRHLREKIEINPKEPRYLKVVWGQGYKIQDPTR